MRALAVIGGSTAIALLINAALLIALGLAVLVWAAWGLSRTLA